MLRGKRIRDGGRLVDGTVVDDDDFDGTVSLPQHAPYRLAQ
jgi:hypothetical protein